MMLSGNILRIGTSGAMARLRVFLIFRTEDVLLLFVSQVVEVQNHETLARECELKAGKKGKADRARNLVCGTNV